MKKRLFATLLLSGALLLTSCGDIDIKKIASAILDEDSSSAQPSENSSSQPSSEAPQQSTSEAPQQSDNSSEPASSAPSQSSSSVDPVSSSSEPQPELTLEISDTAMSLGEGESKKITATASVAGLAVSFASDKLDVAVVDDNGLVTGVKAGTATITVAIVGTSVRAYCDVTVVGSYFIEEDTEILVQTTFNDTFGQIFKDAVEAVQKKEPHLTVKYDKYSGSYSDLKDEVIKGVPAGNYADVVAAYPDSVADFITSNVQLKMDRFMNNADYGWTEEEKNDFYEAYLAEGSNYSIPGTYSLPIAKSTEAMYYDSDKIIGLNLASIDPTINGGNAITEEYINNLTWDELFDKFAPALLAYRETLPTDAAKKAFLDQETYTDWAVVGYDSDDNLFITLAEQYGYGYTSMDPVTGNGKIEFVNDGMKNLMKKFNDAYKNKYFTTKGIIGTNVNYRSNADAMLFSIGSTGGVNYQFSKDNPKNVGVARVPQAPGKATKLIQQGPSLAFLKHTGDDSNNRALGAWLFYKELTSVRSSIAWATTTGYSPIRKSVAESDDFLDFSDPDNFNAKTSDRLKAINAAYQESTMEYLFTSPVFKGSSEARTQVGGLTTKAIGSADLDAEIDKLFNDAYNNTTLKM